MSHPITSNLENLNINLKLELGKNSHVRPNALSFMKVVEIQTAPADALFLKVVATLRVEPAVALGTERLQVAPVVRAAIRQLALVVYQFGGREPPVPLAQLTQRVRRQERRAYPAPAPAVSFVGVWVTVVMVVAFCFFFGVLLTVAPARQVRAPTAGAWLLGFVRHRRHLLRA
jgi:hypothetical protein